MANPLQYAPHHLKLGNNHPRAGSPSSKSSEKKPKEEDGWGKKVADTVKGTGEKFFGWPDRIGDKYPEKEWVKKAANIAFSLGIMGIGVGIGATFLSGSGLLHSFANPTFMDMSIIPLTIAGGALGTSLLLESILGSKQRNVVAKVLAVVAPILMMGGSATLIALGLHHGGGVAGLTNFNTIAGFLSIPAGALVLLRVTIPRLKGNNNAFLTNKMDKKGNENLTNMRRKPSGQSSRGEDIPLQEFSRLET
ncbi:MAG: hypothetical protein K940chlam9_01786 [Chlamydiae bacterium]|nr:hypothetical protein [Chlamydiota bacterium]